MVLATMIIVHVLCTFAAPVGIYQLLRLVFDFSYEILHSLCAAISKPKAKVLLSSHGCGSYGFLSALPLVLSLSSGISSSP